MAWDTDLLPEQKKAAMHAGNHARLLAGPGTGKTRTLTRRICFLVSEKNVPTKSILALTFTRAAAHELRQRVANELGNDQNPRISTLHSFALRQLITNETKITDLPQPLRIADDWEERYIILEDLKALLDLQHIDEARDLLNALSADWQSLTADEADWEKRFPNSRFLGAWREHRQIYGYTLRSELVYQLKKALEQRGDFQLEDSIKYLLVDEYQDLNRCDLAVVEQIASRGVELFVAGDDDQSIYGFRKAHPEGIRRFPKAYPGTTELELEICKRCDRSILDLGLFVARQDPRRIEKNLHPESLAEKGEVELLRFDNQDLEATGIADLCTHLVEQYKRKPGDILILLRSDRNGAFSRPIREELEKANIPVADTDTTNPLDKDDGRAFLAFLRLAASNKKDSLAWRSLLQVWYKGVGTGAIKAVYKLARNRGENFAQTVMASHTDRNILPKNHRSRLYKAISEVLNRLKVLFPEDSRGDYETCADLMEVIQAATERIIKDNREREAILLKVEGFRVTSIKDLVQAIGVEDEDIEQELEKDKVNIMTMHRAKGLTAEAVIIVAAEDQSIPGPAHGEEIADARRLLYVSLTRAKHHLFIMYCDKRTGQQSHTVGIAETLLGLLAGS